MIYKSKAKLSIKLRGATWCSTPFVHCAIILYWIWLLVHLLLRPWRSTFFSLKLLLCYNYYKLEFQHCTRYNFKKKLMPHICCFSCRWSALQQRRGVVGSMIWSQQEHSPRWTSQWWPTHPSTPWLAQNIHQWFR